MFEGGKNALIDLVNIIFDKLDADGSGDVVTLPLA